jgi:divalent metal cation (Fe/Co/Zn/Cd) transporter
VSEQLIVDEQRAVERGRALRLEYFTVAWIVVEAAVGLVTAVIAGSVALMGFSIDSVIECGSAVVLVWRLLAERRAHDPAAIRRLDERAHKLVAFFLYALSVYVAATAVWALWRGERPHPTLIGVGLMVVTIAVMYWLAGAKRRAARALGSCALEADSFQATACMWLSVLTLAGIGLNTLFGWWWADPVAALCMPIFLVQEGRKAWRGEDCGC